MIYLSCNNYHAIKNYGNEVKKNEQEKFNNLKLAVLMG